MTHSLFCEGQQRMSMELDRSGISHFLSPSAVGHHQETSLYEKLSAVQLKAQVHISMLYVMSRCTGPVKGQTAVVRCRVADLKADSDLLQPSHETFRSQLPPDSQQDNSRISTGRVICHKTNCYKSLRQI